MIAADGLWQWSVVDWITPVGLGGPADWDCINGRLSPDPQKLPIIKKVITDRVYGRDELQEVVRAQYPVPGSYYGIFYWWDKWYDEYGGRVESPYGDSQDAFNIGYNQVFSKYSNPPTYDKLRNPIEMAVELISNNNGQFNLQFRMSSSTALDAPPSKPQNLKVTIDALGKSVLSWEANNEPDIITGGKYKIYRAETCSPGETPLFELVTSINAYVSGQPVTTYTDGAARNGVCKLHYKISAFDNTNKESVPSDTVCRVGHLKKESGKGSTPIANYQLYNNYPNPFNPTTTIYYDVKDHGFVNLTIFDILGREVLNLVNEDKEEGQYSIDFDASNLPSGVYIYTLRVNDFTASKKMTVLK
ncbi:MAG: T9SS type A sorting domain-containing protein [Ignavibacteriaceae bacterium]|nr:T9SS type A sorting domain-containing protein [Ignavibacteriaceae bacterium]